MSLLLILPPGELEERDVCRAIKICEVLFPKLLPLGMAADVNLPYYQQLVRHMDIEVELFDVRVALNNYKLFVFVQDYDWNVVSPGPEELELLDSEEQRTYLLRKGVHLDLKQPRQLDQVAFPDQNSHIFGRLSALQHGFAHFPMGPLYIDLGVGPVNEFGFRVQRDYMELSSRPSNHKLVVTFGGSSGFSMYCLPEEVFSQRLENKLNQTMKDSGRDEFFTVLNFGRHDAIVMTELMIYLNFVQKLNPEIIIAHDGHNDIYYGLQGDPRLLNGFDIIYQRHLEEWSKILHSSSQRPSPPLYSMASGEQRFNMPHNMVRAYIERKMQFCKIATSMDSAFIWGVQPLHSSKGNLSAYELKKQRWAEEGGTIYYKPNFQKFMRFLYRTYDQLSGALAKIDNINLVDFHTLFQKYDENYDLFWDHCHMSPEGDEVLASYYHQKIMDLIDVDKNLNFSKRRGRSIISRWLS